MTERGINPNSIPSKLIIASSSFGSGTWITEMGLRKGATSETQRKHYSWQVRRKAGDKRTINQRFQSGGQLRSRLSEFHYFDNLFLIPYLKWIFYLSPHWYPAVRYTYICTNHLPARAASNLNRWEFVCQSLNNWNSRRDVSLVNSFSSQIVCVRFLPIFSLNLHPSIIRRQLCLTRTIRGS